MRALSQDLPRGMRYIETAELGCIYRPSEAARALGLPARTPRAKLEAEMRRRFERGDYGELLGYGAPSVTTRPCHIVTITRNGKDISGFISSADKATALRYAEERKLDFELQFPADKWDYILTFKN